ADAKAIERLEKVDVLVIDKTGTLTVGKPELARVEPVEGGPTSDELLIWVATLERGSEHPLATAIIAGAQERGLRLPSEDAREFAVVPGEGVTGRVGGHQLAVGNRRLLAKFVDAAALEQLGERA